MSMMLRTLHHPDKYLWQESGTQESEKKSAYSYPNFKHITHFLLCSPVKTQTQSTIVDELLCTSRGMISAFQTRNTVRVLIVYCVSGVTKLHTSFMFPQRYSLCTNV